MAATQLRSILVDRARQKPARRRPVARAYKLTDIVTIPEEKLDRVIEIDEAPKRLRESDPNCLGL